MPRPSAEGGFIPVYGRGKRQRVLLRKRVAGATTARETLLEKLRFRYFSAGFRARKGFSPHELPRKRKRSFLKDGVVQSDEGRLRLGSLAMTVDGAIK
jgi:hypothetical protein